MGSSPTCLDPLVIPLVEGPRVLDVASGFGRWGVLCVANHWETVTWKRPEVVGCEGYLPNVEMSRMTGAYSEVIHVRFPPLPFPDRSFDTVLLMEIVEHLEKTEAYRLIDEAKRIARKRVIVSTPNFSMLREGHDTITGFNELEHHLCYISRRDLRRMGFTVYGAGSREPGRIVRGVLRRLRLLDWYMRRVRPLLSGLGALVPSISMNAVGLWIRPNDGGTVP